MADKIGQQIGNYRLVKLLGKGGFAEVYLGQHVHLVTKRAAIKLLNLVDVDVKKFQDEADVTEHLMHPHIVRLLEFAFEQGTPFLVLDYAPGGSLRTRHPKGSIVPLARVREYLKEIAPALQYAHDLRILHPDIKPDNILIGRQGELLLSDFGIAVLLLTGQTSLKASHGIGGTPYYMAPETYQGQPVKESDQYSLAVVVYEWLCGSVPFTGSNFAQLGYQHTHEPVPPLREKKPAIPPQVEAVVLKALAKDPKQRFGSVREFATAFEQACTPPAQPNQSRTEPARPKSAPPESFSRSSPGQPPQPPGKQQFQAGMTSRPTIPATHVPKRPTTFRIPLIGRMPISWVIVLTFVAIGLIYGGIDSFRQLLLPHITNPYVNGGTLTLYDPLSDNSHGYGWDNSGDSTHGCHFSGGAYHVSSQDGSFTECKASPDFRNFTFEVQMQIIKGGCGGLEFRADDRGNGYLFQICQDGNWNLSQTTASGSSSAFHTGLYSSNVIAVVADGNDLDLYVNKQKVDSVTDYNYSQGVIGLTAVSTGVTPVEVVYTNAKVWTL